MSAEGSNRATADTRAELTRGLSMVRLLAAAYEYRESKPPDDLLHWLAPAGAECAIFADPSHEGGIIAAIRGTQGMADIWRDLDAWMTPAFIGPGKVHRGMDVHARHLLQELRPTLRGMDLEDVRVTLALHSLGAGAGPMIARDLVRDGFRVAEIWAFGMPRVGDERFAKAFDAWLLRERIFARRVVAIGEGGRQDLVTRVPLSRRGWWHCMPPLILAEGNVYRTPEDWEAVRRERPFGDRSKIVSWLLQWAVLTRLRWAVGAHGTGHYASALQRALERLEGER